MERQIFLKLALDNQVSQAAEKKLSDHYEIVAKAGDKSDEDWIEEAIDSDANVFISPDYDIPNYLERYYDGVGVYWISLPQGIRGIKQFDYLYKKLKALQARINK